MIPAFVFFTQITVSNQVSSVPEIREYAVPGRDSVAIEAVVKLPDLNSSQRYVLAQAMQVAVQMTPEFGNRDVLHVQKTGTRFRLYMAADHVRIGLTVDKGDFGPGLSLLHSVLTEPSFLADTIKARRSRMTSPWGPAYRGFDLQEAELNHDTMAALWQGIMRPKNISVAVAGTFRGNAPTEKWRSMQTGWVYDAPNQLPLSYPLLAKPLPNPLPIIVYDSKPITVTRASLASYLLAANALGVGKESVQWLVAREAMNLSYRQEAFLLPTVQGWRFRMAYATDEAGTKAEVLAELRTKLRAKCESLTQADLNHAVGIGSGYLAYQMPTLPLLLGIGESLSNDLNDQTYLRHYWRTMYGFDWDAESILLQMKGITLPEMKKLLIQLIDESDVRIY